MGQGGLGVGGVRQTSANFAPVRQLPMSGIVERPVAAPLNSYPELGSYFLADMADNGPLPTREVPRFRAVNDIDRQPVIMRALPIAGLGQATHEQTVLLIGTAIDAMPEQGHPELSTAANQPPLKLKNVRVRPFTIGAALLGLPFLREAKRLVCQRPKLSAVNDAI